MEYAHEHLEVLLILPVVFRRIGGDSRLDDFIQLFWRDFAEETGNGDILPVVGLREKAFQLLVNQINEAKAEGEELRGVERIP